MSTVKIRRSGTASSTPASLDHGELAINYADDTLFWKDSANVIKSFVFQAYASATHASTHATGGSDALTPGDIGAAPAASPVFSGNVGIGTSPTSFNSSFNNVVIGNGSSVEGMTIYSSTQGTLAFGDTATTGADGYRGYLAYIHSGDYMAIGTGGAERFRAYASGVIVSGVITVSATSGSAGSYAPSVTFSGDSNTGFGQVSGQSDTASIFTAGSERVRVTSGGNVGIGTSSPSAKLDINSDTIRLRTAKTPASASDTGNAGDICWDADYVYICVSANSWKRASLASW